MRGIVQSILVGIQMALVEMRSHKLRSGLSLFGVMLGVSSLVAMLTLIGGIDVFLHKKMGVWMGSVWFTPRTDPQDDEKLTWSRSPGLRLSDGDYLEENAPQVKDAIQQIERRGSIVIAGQQERGRFLGTTPAALSRDIENLTISDGRWITDQEYRTGARVCVVSWEFADRVAQRQRGRDGGRSIVGQFVQFGGVQFRIVGRYDPADPDVQPWQLRRCVMVPLQAVRQFVTGYDPNPGSVEVSLKDLETVKEQAPIVARALQQRHRGVEDYEFRTAEWLEELGGMLGNVSVLMGLISAISLLVGGLSIMNVMLSSISERIHEIGIRKALGAKTLQIFVQFIVETTTLSFSGGVCGILLGLAPLLFSAGIKKASEGVIEPTVLPQHVAFVFLILALVGAVFGLYPAIRASRLNPVEALRHE